MTICSATKRDGSPCTLQATGKQGVCWAHDERNAEKRRQRAAKGGKGKANNELRDLKAKVEKLAEDVLEGEVATGRGAVVNQLYNTLVRAIELERKQRKLEEIEERLAAIESRHGIGRGFKW